MSANLINSLSTTGNLHSCFLYNFWHPSLTRGQMSFAKDVAGKINGHKTEWSPWGTHVCHPLGFLHQGTSWEGPHGLTTDCLNQDFWMWQQSKAAPGVNTVINSISCNGQHRSSGCWRQLPVLHKFFPVPWGRNTLKILGFPHHKRPFGFSVPLSLPQTTE